MDFTLANIFVPDPKETPQKWEERRLSTQSKLQERVGKLRERSRGREHQVVGYYSEDQLLTAARNYVGKNRVDLIVMGAVGKKFRHSTILGDHTFEIISKVKCNILAVPEKCTFQGLEKMLLPIDYSASFRYGNIRFLNEERFFRIQN